MIDQTTGYMKKTEKKSIVYVTPEMEEIVISLGNKVLTGSEIVEDPDDPGNEQPM